MFLVCSAHGAPRPPRRAAPADRSDGAVRLAPACRHPARSRHRRASSGRRPRPGCAARGGVLARTEGPVIWALIRPDLFAPALDAVGLHPDRVIFAHAGTSESVLMAMEEALREPGLGGVVGEIEGRLGLTASRRLQLAAEVSGTLGIALRRSRRQDDPASDAPSAVLTRWRITTLPSAPPLLHAPEVPGLGRARWQLELRRARGAAPRTWIVEACDAQGRLGLPADLEHGSDQVPNRRRAG